MSEKRGKKRPKSYYRKSCHQKRQRLNNLAAGMRGFLITCNNNEKQAVRECYNILNEYADEMYGPEKLTGKDGDSDKSDSEEEEDVEKAMARELKAIKEVQQSVERRFQNTDTHAKNCIFIRTSLDNPTELHHKIFSDLYEKKVTKARYAMRMLPIAGTCKAVLDEVKKLADNILPPYFPSEKGQERSYAVMFKVRNNNGIGRDSVLPLLGEVVKSLNPLNRVNCDSPDVAVLVEIISNVCCLGVSTDFFKFRKCNFHEVVKEATVKKGKDIKSEEKAELSGGENGSETKADEQKDTAEESDQKPVKEVAPIEAKVKLEVETDDGTVTKDGDSGGVGLEKDEQQSHAATVKEEGEQEKCVTKDEG
ncbi:THUMP domain-containing protein 1-like [Haliotis cracherodii]|uniref:THUMP domain-containing protein 1-like n=1 Tax=Haliotis cracherodii TaxID=6455 RepID=UPI0039E9F6FD